MNRSFLLFCFCFVGAGCIGAGGGPAADQDVVPVFDAVLKHEFPDPKQPDSLFLFVDGKDPEPKVLEKLGKPWPMLQPGSKVPEKGPATRVSLSEVKFSGRDAVELSVGVSNGKDGRLQHFWMSRKDGKWVVDKTKVEATS